MKKLLLFLLLCTSCLYSKRRCLQRKFTVITSSVADHHSYIGNRDLVDATAARIAQSTYGAYSEFAYRGLFREIFSDMTLEAGRCLQNTIRSTNQLERYYSFFTLVEENRPLATLAKSTFSIIERFKRGDVSSTWAYAQLQDITTRVFSLSNNSSY